MIKIAVLVSGGGTNLQALIDSAPYENGALSLVLSSHPNAFALERAARAGIEALTLDPKEYADREDYTGALVDVLLARDIGLVVFGGFMFILTPRFAEVFENRAINVHPSLIPAFCGKGFYGLRVHKAVLEYGVKVTGATVHFVTTGADEGPIISQKAIDVLPDDTPESLQRRVMEQCEWPLLTAAVREFCSLHQNIANTSKNLST
ncbi:MAG: phosphoribosylglycinamide formyltransferase [Oscillospiraceae bacterium]|jgi:phosphoribosylglycinamide formyltransferase-1|nr:phosphoribosylglycinamide formyltransferase [Oscillospiraceae bacterium]